jgi:hypothetical protein
VNAVLVVMDNNKLTVAAENKHAQRYTGTRAYTTSMQKSTHDCCNRAAKG